MIDSRHRWIPVIVLCALGLACTGESPEPPLTTGEEFPAAGAPAAGTPEAGTPEAPPLAPERRHEPERLGIQVNRIQRALLAQPIALVDEAGDVVAATEILLLVVEGERAAAPLEIGETTGAPWMVNRSLAEVAAFSADGQRVVLMVPDPGNSLKDTVLWQRPPISRLAPPQPPGKMREELQRELGDLARGTRPGFWLGDGQRTTVPIDEERAELTNRRALDRLARQLAYDEAPEAYIEGEKP